MASPMLCRVCLLFAFMMHNADGALRLEVNPRIITPGLTESLTLNCSFSFAGLSNMSFSDIISLIVSKSGINVSQQGTFEDLVFVNAFTPDTVTELSQLDAVVTGLVDVNGESYITIVWPYPTANESGLYKCEIIGMDNIGHTLEISQTWLVTSQRATLEQLIDKVGQLQRKLSLQEIFAKNQSNENAMLESNVEQFEVLSKNHSDKISVLESKLEQYEVVSRNHSGIIALLDSQLGLQENLAKNQAEIISAQQSLLLNQSRAIAHMESKLNLLLSFHISDQYGGHYYLLSKDLWHDANVVAKTCRNYGGYLAVITDDSENQFVKNFVDEHSGFTHVLLNGTDSGHEGRWTFTGTNHDLVFTDWGEDEPANDQQANCMGLARGRQWQWYDGPCARICSNTCRFLCELET